MLYGEIIDHNIADFIELKISPTPLESIDAVYYAKGELLSADATENESTKIVPGRYGLLKRYVYRSS